MVNGKGKGNGNGSWSAIQRLREAELPLEVLEFDFMTGSVNGSIRMDSIVGAGTNRTWLSMVKLTGS
jgi:hypothetical protein